MHNLHVSKNMHICIHEMFVFCSVNGEAEPLTKECIIMNDPFMYLHNQTHDLSHNCSHGFIYSLICVCVNWYKDTKANL